MKLKPKDYATYLLYAGRNYLRVRLKRVETIMWGMEFGGDYESSIKQPHNIKNIIFGLCNGFSGGLIAKQFDIKVFPADKCILSPLAMQKLCTGKSKNDKYFIQQTCESGIWALIPKNPGYAIKTCQLREVEDSAGNSWWVGGQIRPEMTPQMIDMNAEMANPPQ